MRKVFLLLLMLSFFLFVNDVYCDMTFIPTDFVDVQEPFQVAVVSWNNGVEVMLFGINLVVPSGIKGMGLMPLPSKPEVFLGSSKSYYYINELFKRAGRGTAGLSPGFDETEIMFNVILGPYNVTCIRVEPNATYEDIEDSLLRIASENSLGTLAVEFTHVALIKSYASKGYNYFLVNVINAENYTEGYLPPLVIKFRTNHIWYPIEISMLYEGYMRIGVIVITPREFVYTGRSTHIWNIRRRTIVSRSFIERIDLRLLSVFSLFDVWFNAYVYGAYYASSDDLYFDFTGYITGSNINILYYTILFVLLTFLTVGLLIGPIKIEEKTKRILLLSIHVLATIVLAIIAFSGILFMPLIEYIGKTSMLAQLYVYSSIGLMTIVLVLLLLVLMKILSYIRTRDMVFLTRKYLGLILALIHIAIILLIVSASALWALTTEMWAFEAYQAMVTMIVIYLGIVLFIQSLLKKK